MHFVDMRSLQVSKVTTSAVELKILPRSIGIIIIAKQIIHSYESAVPHHKPNTFIIIITLHTKKSSFLI